MIAKGTVEYIHYKPEMGCCNCVAENSEILLGTIESKQEAVGESFDTISIASRISYRPEKPAPLTQALAPRIESAFLCDSPVFRARRTACNSERSSQETLGSARTFFDENFTSECAKHLSSTKL